MIGPMFSLTFFIGLGVMWLLSAFILTLGIFFVGKISDWRGDEGFWTPFPAAMLAAFILTLVDVGLSFIHIPLLPFIAKVVIWCVVIMKAFAITLWEATLLAIILFVLKLLLAAFILSAIFSMIPS